MRKSFYNQSGELTVAVIATSPKAAREMLGQPPNAHVVDGGTPWMPWRFEPGARVYCVFGRHAIKHRVVLGNTATETDAVSDRPSQRRYWPVKAVGS